MKRYGKGWYNESHRHYLAAKGIKTKYFAPKKVADIKVDGKKVAELSEFKQKGEDRYQLDIKGVGKKGGQTIDVERDVPKAIKRLGQATGREFKAFGGDVAVGAKRLETDVREDLPREIKLQSKRVATGAKKAFEAEERVRKKVQPKIEKRARDFREGFKEGEEKLARELPDTDISASLERQKEELQAKIREIKRNAESSTTEMLARRQAAQLIRDAKMKQEIEDIQRRERDLALRRELAK